MTKLFLALGGEPLAEKSEMAVSGGMTVAVAGERVDALLAACADDPEALDLYKQLLRRTLTGGQSPGAAESPLRGGGAGRG